MPLVFVAAEKLGGEPGSQAQKEKGRESWRAAAESRPCGGLPTVTGHWSASQGPPPPLLLPALPVWASLGTISGPFFFFSPMAMPSLWPPPPQGKMVTQRQHHTVSFFPACGLRTDFLSELTPASKLSPTQQICQAPRYIPSSAPHSEERALGKVGRSTVNTVKKREGGPAIAWLEREERQTSAPNNLQARGTSTASRPHSIQHQGGSG